MKRVLSCYITQLQKSSRVSGFKSFTHCNSCLNRQTRTKTPCLKLCKEFHISRHLQSSVAEAFTDSSLDVQNNIVDSLECMGYEDLESGDVTNVNFVENFPDDIFIDENPESLQERKKLQSNDLLSTYNSNRVMAPSKYRLTLEQTVYADSKHSKQKVSCIRSNDPYEDPHIASAESAKILIDFVKRELDIENDQSIYLDANAGRGFLSQELLASGAKHLLLCHKNPKYHEHLVSTAASFPHSAYVYNTTMITLQGERTTPTGSVLYTDNHSRDIHIFQDKYRRNWESDPAVRLFLIDNITEEETLARFCIASLLEKRGLFSLGRVDIFMLCTPELTSVLFDQVDSRKHMLPVKLSMLYDMQLLGELSLSSICLSTNKAGSNNQGLRFSYHKVAKGRKSETASLHLLRLTAKKDPVGDGSYGNFSHTVLPAFYIIQQAMKYRKYLLPELESILTDCMYEIISLGYECNVKLQDLKNEDLFKIVKALQRMPSYSKSLFSMLHKMTRTCVEVDQGPRTCSASAQDRQMRKRR